MQQVSRGSTLLLMQYQVIARKWRPQNFSELVGQDHVSRTLLNALQSGRVAHAFLFSGPRGSGKTTTARILAKALNCHGGKPGEPCGQCVSCREIAAGNCIDVLEIDAASNTGVDNVRQLIEQARYFPARDRNKVFIIDEVHMLSNAAFSALLKTLEEPPAHVVFIMATTEYHKIPATILSRCQQYSFKLIAYPLILDRLRLICEAEGIQISRTALDQVVFSSGGSMRDAMSALDQVIAFSGDHVEDEDVTALLGLIEPKVLSRTVRAIAANDLESMLKVVGELVEAGQDLNNFVRRLAGQFRNLMVMKAGIAEPALLGVPESLLAELQEQAGLFSREDMLRIFDGFQRVETAMKYATQVRFQLEMGLIELAHLARLRPLEDLIAEFRGGSERDALRKTADRPEPASPPNVRPTERPPAANMRQGATRAPDAGKDPAPATREIPASQPPASAPVSAPPVREPREFLIEIASAVGRESLEALLLNLGGARLEGDRVVLESGASNEFSRRQISENLPAISQAASRIVGNTVTAVLVGTDPIQPAPSPLPRPGRLTPPEGDLLEKAKREPIVKSFLDVFPGPVKAEKIDS